MERRNLIEGTMAMAATGPVLVSGIAGNATNNEGFVLRTGKARNDKHTPYRGKNPNDLKISSRDTGGHLSVFEYIGVEKIGPPLHIHLEQDEIFYVVEGEYKFRLAEEYFELKAGDIIFLPRNIPHTWIQTTDKGKLLYCLQPAVKMEEFFQTMHNLGRAPSPEEDDTISMAHGIKIIGPPLSL